MGQVNDSLLNGFFAGNPISMMKVRAPNASIKLVEVVIMFRDSRDIGNGRVRDYHTPQFNVLAKFAW